MKRRKDSFQTIRSEGGLLPADLLRRVVDPKAKLAGANPEDYGLPQGERINETITQSWNRLRRHWAEFRAAAKSLPEIEPGTGLTNDKWNLPLLRELGFGFLATTPGPQVEGRTYAINRFFGPTAIHLVGCGLSLDRRAAGVRGAAASNPHGLVQEFLNRSPGHLWAILSNGLRFRVLRDNQALSRQSFLEFDLEAIFTGEVFPDFVLLWLMAHATRFAPREEARPETCWLEQWTKLADDEGTRALGALRAGVEKSLQILGEAFVSHPRNTALREALRNETLTLSDFHGQLLRLVYRLIFLFVAEDRTLEGVSLLHPRDESDAARQARERYAAHYSTARLRDLAGKIKGSRHGDLWQQFNLLVGALSGDSRFETARQQLAIPVLRSFLWSPASTNHLNAASLNADGTGIELANADFLEALRHLAFTRQGKVLRPVDYKNLGAEELGGVYESLLALTPQISGDGARFTFAEFAGNERKTSGSYYTPDSLVQCLLDSALDPVVDEAIKGKSGPYAEQAILALKVCDPAVGSGHFLVGAAHRLARHLARIRANMQGESEPSPLLYQHALRDVIGRCLYGVDINPMSAELCRVSLWLEALEPGKPLSFLEHHIQVGNSLLGTTPALLERGLSDDAFTPIEGDVKTRVTELKKRNKKEREDYANRQGYLFDPPIKLGNLAAELARIDEASDETAEGIAEKERRYVEFVKGSGYQFGRLLADTWCAAFVWQKDDTDLGKLCPTERDFRKVESHAATGLLPHVRAEVERLRDQYQFFHWHLAFPDVFRLPGKDETPDNVQSGWSGGFDVVLGNPPWERVNLEEKEWFASRNPSIATASTGAARKRKIDDLTVTDATLREEYIQACRYYSGLAVLLRSTDRFPLCAKGRINTFAVFAELNLNAISATGRVGCIVPTGIATDDNSKEFFQFLISKNRLVSLIDFENRRQLFPAVDSRYKFCLLTISGSDARNESASFSFFAHDVTDIADPGRTFTLTSADISLLNPNTLTCPIFQTRKDAELTRRIYQRFPVLVRKVKDGRASAWAIQFRQGLFNMTTDSGSFRDSESLREEGFKQHGNRFERDGVTFLPLYEAKMIHQFNHRHASIGGQWGTVAANQGIELSDDELNCHDTVAIPRYWVHEQLVNKELPNMQWAVGFRDITRATDFRTFTVTVLPRSGVGNNLPLIHFGEEITADHVGCFITAANAFATDFFVRQKIGGIHLNFYLVEQFAVPTPKFFDETIIQNGHCFRDWLKPRFLELLYTSHDIEAFARSCGYDGPPYKWDPERRMQIRCEIDAAYFLLFGLAHSDVEYILDTFPIVRQRDQRRFGDFRTKLMILHIFDQMVVHGWHVDASAPLKTNP